MVPPQRLWVFSISTAPVRAKCSPLGRMVVLHRSGGEHAVSPASGRSCSPDSAAADPPS